MQFENEYLERCQRGSDIKQHLPTLYEYGKGSEVIELGVRGGNSTCAFLAGIETAGGHLWSVDIDKPRIPAHWHDSELWDFILGDDLLVSHRLPDACDVVFIDTSHAFDQTIEELELYAPRARRVVLLHDTELEHPENTTRFPPYPVREAIDRYCEQHGLSWTNSPGCNGLGIVEVS